MFLHVTSVIYLEGYRLRISFSDGSVKEVDLQEYLWGTVFEPLRDLELFRQVQLDEHGYTVEWPNGADLAPEFLYEIGEPVRQPV